MTAALNQDVFEFLGTTADDFISEGFENPTGDILSQDDDTAVWVNGRDGDDEISTGKGNDLAAGDMVGNEWTYVDGKWTYNQDEVVISNYGFDKSFNDLIVTGAGNDVLLGNGGHDQLFAGAGNDIVNAGYGNDQTFGGLGNDTMNLEQGNDYAEGGWTCHGYVPASELIYAAFRSKAKHCLTAYACMCERGAFTSQR